MSETASFVDPVFLARFGLNRTNVLDYFLHPLNPFRTTVNTSNEVVAMQGIGIGIFMQQGLHHGEPPLSPQQAEIEYHNALAKLTGEQYELMPPSEPSLYAQPSPLYTIRHVLRTNPTTTKVLGIYYVVEGVIYKAPSVRSVMKTNVTRTLEGLSGACEALAPCARYLPSLGYTWVFDPKEKTDPYSLMQMAKKRKRRKILDNRRPGERTAAEEEGIRASEAIDQILVRISKSSLLVK
ncbi:mediator of RNA polymerase II transcription subunit 6 [Fistulifera solaris]|uniref:Mediator of RNA polymerase II transcription subunit 6 n=1 Tax=Fistulifera solaris TaxID=1519565 RepID=A0A1Z5J5Z4_FISSO|nr:mediator of RNA polymerase II transcription subunit 6 [Fistulifera solaris]|eukprot:GAX09414.1 mediator of RNA polymerase II transcription subunit 6 [Fistulifera solaris]